MSFSAQDVMKLRDRTNLPMMDCKAALTETGGDMTKAIELLRTKFAKVSTKFADREAAEGRVAIYIDPATKVGAIVEVRCETAPSAKSDQFIGLTQDLAKHVALAKPGSLEEINGQKLFGTEGRTVTERIQEVIGVIRENMKVHRFKRLEGLMGEYTHHDGSVGVLLLVDGEAIKDPQVARDVCMHVAARVPMAAKREDVPAATIEKEKEIAVNQLKNDPKNANKPANVMEKILEGKLKTWYEDNVLVDQKFVKDETISVGDLLKKNGLTLNCYVRYKVGEISA